MHTRKIGEKYREVPWGCGTLEPRPNHGSHPTWQTSMAPWVWPRSRRGPWGIQKKIKKMEKQCMKSWWVMHHLGKIPNMASQGFTCGLFHKKVLPGRSSLGLPCKVTMVCASSTANVEPWSHFLWKYASLHSQQLLQLVFFQFPHKKCISHFSGARRGRNRCFFVKGHQGQCAKHHQSNFHGWGTYQGCHIQEVRNYLGLLPYNELFLP
jgi:hypothetical protein